MANTEKEAKKLVKRPSPLKRIDQAEKRQTRNRAVKSQIRTTSRSLQENLSKDVQEASQTLSRAYSILDKAVKKGVIKPNKASRTKARLAAKINKKPA